GGGGGGGDPSGARTMTAFEVDGVGEPWEITPMFSTRRRRHLMTFLILASAAAIVAGVLAMLWLYSPWLRRPWLPTTAAREQAEQVAQAGGTFPLEQPRVVVHKAARTLELFDGGRLVQVYTIALGTNPVDAKRKEGDGCTPEGTFYVCTKNERSRYHLFLGLSYPAVADAERGLRAGQITRAQHDEIVAATGARTRPPWNTPLGGEVGIHGGGTSSDWTVGCIALDNADIEQLFLLLDLGDEVVIEP
ncbi:MAG: L,D-transpeptidase family protein, partial [Verrucomicrobia bacterium]|nr:L,D-transpeptidase family protein [Verrucomicrobiota bacterium]